MSPVARGILFIATLCFAVSPLAAQYYYPKVTAASLASAGPFSSGQAVTVQFAYAPGTQGAKSVGFWFKSTDGKYSRSIFTDTPATGVATSTINSDWPTGTYQLDTIAVTDGLGNYASYAPDGTLKPGSHLWFVPAPAPSPNLSSLSFAVTGGPSSLVAPTLTSFTRTSPTQLTAGNPITLSYNVTGGTASPWVLKIQLRTADNQSISLPAVEGTGSTGGTITVPTDGKWVNGTYTIQSASVWDTYKSTTYTRSVSGTLPTSLDFTLSGGVTTAVRPEVTSVQVLSSGPFSVGQTVTIKCSMASGSSTVTQVALTYAGPDCPPSYGGNVSFSGTADGTVSFQVRPDMIDGDYRLKDISIVDASGHIVGYFRQGGNLIPAGVGSYLSAAGCDFKVSGALTIPPTISKQPSGGAVDGGKTLTLNVEVSGPPPTSVKWYEGQSGDTSRLVWSAGSSFTPAPPASTTSYWARITTPFGTVDSAAATISVNYPTIIPVIITAPQPIDSFSNNWGSLGVIAVGPPPITYQWYKDGAAISGATANKLNFNPGQVTDNGRYYVTVSNPNGTATSDPVSVVFVGAPQITTQPINVTVPLGGTATFSVEAIGGDLQYSWSFTGQANGSSTLYGTNGNPTLTLTNVQPHYAGTYYVQISNMAGRINSVPVTLTVTTVPVPVFKAIPTSYGQVNQYAGRSVWATNYPVHYTASGLPPGMSIDDYGNISGTPTASGTFNVTVNALNAGGTAATTFTYIIAPGPYGPIITEQPQSQAVALNTQVTLSVTAVGTLTSAFGLDYQWYFNGQPLTYNGRYSTYNLSVNSSSQAGDYYVVVYGATGPVTSSVAHITIDAGAAAPRITSGLTDQTVAAGGNLTLSIQASGTAPLTYKWYRYSVLIPSATGPSLTITNASQADVGQYEVSVSNAYGYGGSSFATVLVKYTIQPSSITIRPGQTATLSVPASSAVKYQWYQGTSGNYSTSTRIEGATQATYTTPALTASTNYWVEVSAGNFTYSPTATVTVSAAAQNFGGTYFGTFSDGGKWAMVIDSSNTGTFCAYWPQPAQSLVGTVTVSSDGTFTVVATAPASAGVSAHAITEQPTTTRDLASPILGVISGGQVSSAISAMTGAMDSGSSAAAYAGTYNAVGLNGTGGTATVIVGGSGQAFALIKGPAGVFGATGVITSDGQLATADGAGNKIALQLSAESHTTSAVLTPAGATPQSYSGLATNVKNTSRLMNLSARANVLSGADIAIVGFVMKGALGKSLLIRGVGPSLNPLGVSNYLVAPWLAVFDARSHEIWSGTRSGNADVIQNTGARVGAFALQTNAIDCTFIGTMNAGSYSVQLSGLSGTTGVGVAEIYDADALQTDTRLVNLSARARTASGADVLVAGFVISGNGPETVLLRGVGPGLAAFGVPGYLTNPKLVLYNSSGQTIATNNGWNGDATLKDAFARVGAFNLDPTSKDTALMLNLLPGGYTVQVQSQDGSSGVAIVEVYEVTQ